jgi:hypothetical protein
MKNLILIFTLSVYVFSCAILSAQDANPDKEKAENQILEQTKTQTKEQAKEKTADGNGDQVQNQSRYQSKTQSKEQVKEKTSDESADQIRNQFKYQTRTQHAAGFIDEDGDGINDNRNDQEGDSPRNGQDDDFEPSQDGANNKQMNRHGKINGQNMHNSSQNAGNMNGEGIQTGSDETRNSKASKNKGGKN